MLGCTDVSCAAPAATICANSHGTDTAAKAQAGAQFHGDGTTPARAIWMTATRATANWTNEST